MSALLIFGSSHVGKSTLAQRVGATLRWPVYSTDKMGRHPGRPWPDVKAPVKEFYERLSPETIYWFLRTHHENMWPLLSTRIESFLAEDQDFILEGAALRPENLSLLAPKDILIVGLSAQAEVLRERMQDASGYADLPEERRRIIDAFIARSLRDASTLTAKARELGMRVIDVTEQATFDTLAIELTSTLR